MVRNFHSSFHVTGSNLYLQRRLKEDQTIQASNSPSFLKEGNASLPSKRRWINDCWGEESNEDIVHNVSEVSVLGKANENTGGMSRLIKGSPSLLYSHLLAISVPSLSPRPNRNDLVWEISKRAEMNVLVWCCRKAKTQRMKWCH